MESFVEPLWISVKLSFIVTAVLFFITLPIAYFLAFKAEKSKVFIEAISAMPIVLPPTVIGFYLLLILGQNAPLGAFFYKMFDINLLFSFTGLVIASVFYSFPFMMQPLQAGFEGTHKTLIEASYTMGKSKFQTLARVILPNMKPAILSATVVTFAHTMGEFGVVLMVGGNIPGVTKVASVAIYDEVENLNFATGHLYSAILMTFSFLVLLLVYLLNKKYKITR